MTTRAEAQTISEDSVRDIAREQGEPDWLLERRLDSWHAFEALAMPNPLEEEWRRTDISGLDLEAALASLGQTAPARALRLPRDLQEADGHDGLLVQLDGRPIVSYRDDDLPPGVVFCDLHEAARSHPDVLRASLHSLVQPGEWKLQALAAAIWQGGALVYVPRNQELRLPLRLVTAQAGGLLAPHMVVVADENSSVTVIQESFSTARDQTLASGAVEVICRPNARVKFLDVQRWSPSAYAFSTIRARLEQGADFDASLIGLGGRLVRTRLEVSLAGEGARADLVGLSFGNGEQHFDYITLQDHLAPRTSSDLLFKAALADRASEVWYGTVRIHKGAGQSDANQTSRNLLLSDRAKAAPIPVLEIEAYDVLRCSHGATAGPLDEDQRFYLESRGVPPEEAERLLVDAFFQDALERVPAGSLRRRVDKALAAKLKVGGGR